MILPGSDPPQGPRKRVGSHFSSSQPCRVRISPARDASTAQIISPALPPPVEATLTSAASNPGSRLAFVPARLSRRRETLLAKAVPSRGSHDVLAHARADGLLVLPPRARLADGDCVNVYPGTEETTLGAFE